MDSFPVLSAITFLPLVGALIILFFVREDDNVVGSRRAQQIAF